MEDIVTGSRACDPSCLRLVKRGQPKNRQRAVRSRRLIRQEVESHRDQQWRTGPDPHSPATEVGMDRRERPLTA